MAVAQMNKDESAEGTGLAMAVVEMSRRRRIENAVEKSQERQTTITTVSSVVSCQTRFACEAFYKASKGKGVMNSSVGAEKSRLQRVWMARGGREYDGQRRGEKAKGRERRRGGQADEAVPCGCDWNGGRGGSERGDGRHCAWRCRQAWSSGASRGLPT